MFIPVGFDAPHGRQPICVYVLVALCSLLWLLSGDFPYRVPWARDLVAWQGDMEQLRKDVSEEAERALEDIDRARPAVPEDHPARVQCQRRADSVESMVHWTSRPWTLLTCAFLHGGPMHLIGNMVFLFIFGRSVNSWLGTLRFSLLYVLLAIISSLGHILFGYGNSGGLVGASGALSGVMGLALALFPQNKVKFFYFIRFRWGTFHARAFSALLLWFAWDVIQELLCRGMELQAGTAFMAHVMGFAAGIFAGLLMLNFELTERHDGDIISWFSGRSERLRRASVREYIHEMEEERRAAPAPSLNDMLNRGPDIKTFTVEDVPPLHAPQRSLPSRSRTASFESTPAPPAERTRNRPGSTPDDEVALVVDGLLAAGLDPSRRKGALNAFARFIDRHPDARLSASAARSAADVAHLERNAELEVLAAERFALHYPDDVGVPLLVTRAAEACRHELRDQSRAERLLKLGG